MPGTIPVSVDCRTTLSLEDLHQKMWWRLQFSSLEEKRAKRIRKEQGVKCKELEFQGQEGVQPVYCLTFFSFDAKNS